MIRDFHWTGNAFVSKIIEEFQAGGSDLRHWSIDHICYRVATTDRYRELRDSFSQIASLLIESQVNGRPISTFRLHEPLRWKDRRIELLELPAPKPSKPTREGFEHIEVVCDIPFDELRRGLASFELDDSGLRKLFNQELEVVLESGSIKFHHLSLESVIRLESNARVYQAIQGSRVLELLKDENPLIAGTFPLGLETSASDVDIIANNDQLGELDRRLRDAFGEQNEFESRRVEKNGRPTLLTRFEYQGVPFEIFVQPFPSVKQTAYQHFLAEEKILKLGGDRLRDQILELRRQGLKTEPAFAEVLQLQGDPYLELLLYTYLDEDTILAKLG